MDGFIYKKPTTRAVTNRRSTFDDQPGSRLSVELMCGNQIPVAMQLYQALYVGDMSRFDADVLNDTLIYYRHPLEAPLQFLCNSRICRLGTRMK